MSQEQLPHGRFGVIADGIDSALSWLKWPVAICLTLLLLPTISACLSLVIAIVRKPQPLIPFFGGLALYLVIWSLFIRNWKTTLLSTLEHEFTHALFAVLTFHRVVGLKTTWKDGGHVRYVGRGNWLITLAPYFCPTICFLILSVLVVARSLQSPVTDAVLGAAFAYHVTSMIRETHSKQSDLKRAGWVFSLMALPTLVLITHGAVLAWCYGDRPGLGVFLTAIWQGLNSLLR